MRFRPGWLTSASRSASPRSKNVKHLPLNTSAVWVIRQLSSKASRRTCSRHLRQGDPTRPSRVNGTWSVRRQGYPQTSARTCVTRLQVSWCRPGQACVRCRRAPVAIAAGGRRQWVARSQLPRANTRSTVDADMASRIEQLRTSVPMRRIAAVVGRSVATLSRVSSGRMLRPSSRVISTRPCNPSYRSGCRCAEGWRRRS
jgi:hypothetical protein